MKWLWVSALLLIAGPAGAQEEALSVRTQPVKSFTMFSQLVTFGGLEWRGGIELASDDSGKPAAETLWRDKPQHGISPINVQPHVVGNTMYGVDANGRLYAIEIPSGKRLWDTWEPISERPEGSGTAFIVRQGDTGDRYWLFNDSGDIIIANMERWRWMPRDLGKTHVMVNIPNYSLTIVRDGSVYWQTRIVVGKPSQATPITSAEMKYITVNPTWNVPPSIIQNEYLPALAQDPTVLERMGLKIEQAADGTVRIWQPPGDRNALGRIRFNFPNKFLVYQHDTPDKHLFAHDKRAYSHGCMRVQDPAMYAEVLLGIALPNAGYSQERIKRMYGTSEQNINFPAPIPVHITYQTAFVDDAGKLQIRDDIYGRDNRVLVALKDERRVADIPVERAQPSYSRPPARLPSGVAYDGGYSRQPSFFEMLFGGGGPAQLVRVDVARHHPQSCRLGGRRA